MDKIRVKVSSQYNDMFEENEQLVIERTKLWSIEELEAKGYYDAPSYRDINDDDYHYDSDYIDSDVLSTIEIDGFIRVEDIDGGNWFSWVKLEDL